MLPLKSRPTTTLSCHLEMLLDIHSGNDAIASTFGQPECKEVPDNDTRVSTFGQSGRKEVPLGQSV